MITHQQSNSRATVLMASCMKCGHHKNINPASLRYRISNVQHLCNFSACLMLTLDRCLNFFSCVPIFRQSPHARDQRVDQRHKGRTNRPFDWRNWSAYSSLPQMFKHGMKTHHNLRCDPVRTNCHFARIKPIGMSEIRFISEVSNRAGLSR
jgi:hypothetical protein